MKITKSKLKQIIKEELGGISEAPDDALSQVQSLYDAWNPSDPAATTTGYKKDLGKLIKKLGGTPQEHETLEE